MRITAKMSMIMSAVFTMICLGFALSGFWSLGEITDPQQLSDAKGFALFWLFLAAIAMVFGGLSWWLLKSSTENE